MGGWSPPPPPRALLAGTAVGWALLFAYMVLVRASILLGLLPGVALAGAYVLWRFLVALEAIADGVHRIADSRED